MTAPAKTKESLLRNGSLGKSYRFFHNACCLEEGLSLQQRLRLGLTFPYHRQFQSANDAYSALVRRKNQLRKLFCFWFIEKNRNQGGGIQNHFGRP